MAPKANGRAGGGGGGYQGGGGKNNAISYAELVGGPAASPLAAVGGPAMATAANPSPIPGVNNDVMQTMLMMNMMGGGGKTNISVSPLELMQLKQALTSQHQTANAAATQQAATAQAEMVAQQVAEVGFLWR